MLTLRRLAQAAYPNRTIKMVVPYPAAALPIFSARLVADQLKTGLGATVIVENKPGAGTTLGADQVAKPSRRLHAADGDLDHARHQQDALQEAALRSGQGFYTDRAGRRRAVRADRQSVDPGQTLAEFIAYAKSKPGLSYGSAGNGSPQHLGAEMLKTAAGIDIRHVPYRGSVPAMQDVIGGHIPFMVVDLQPALQQIRDGKVRVLGVTTPKRVAAAPDIPTLAEAGLPGFELVAWQGVVAPAGVPRPIVDQLAARSAH